MSLVPETYMQPLPRYHRFMNTVHLPLHSLFATQSRYYQNSTVSGIVRGEKIKDYEISLGNFKTQTDAQNFILQFPYLKTTIEKTTLGYIVKLKDKFQLKEAISISKSITTEYKIIPNLVERYYDEKYN